MKKVFLFSTLSIFSLTASANCQEKIAKLLGLPKMAGLSMSPLPPTDEYQDYFVSYMTEEKMGTMIARCFNDESKEAFAVPDTNPGANPAYEAPSAPAPVPTSLPVTGTTVVPTAAPTTSKAAFIGPPIPTQNSEVKQIHWRN